MADTPDNPITSRDEGSAAQQLFPVPLTEQVVAEIGSEMGAAIRRQLRSDTVRYRDRGLTPPA